MTDANGGSSLVGREVELAVVVERLRAAVGGTGQLVLIEGEPGIGKTRLLIEALLRGAELGMHAMAGTAEFATNQPFAPLVGALRLDSGPSDDPLLTRVSDLLAASSGAPTTGDLRFAVIDALLEVVERHAANGPVLLAIDDLHWADAGTLLTLLNISRAAPALPLAIVGAFRPVPTSEALNVLVGEGETHLVLGGLGPGAVAELAGRALGATPGAGVLARTEKAGGNPFFVLELIESLRSQGHVDVTDGRAEMAGGTAASGGLGSVVRGLDQLGTEARELVRMASVLGTAFRPDDLAALAGRPTSTLLPLFEEALQARTLGEIDDRLAFRHDITREAAYDEVPLHRRSALHRRAADVLSARGAPAMLVAEHLLLSSPRGDSAAVAWLRRAADEIGSYAPGQSAEFLRQALEFCPADDPQRVQLQADAVSSLAFAGALGESEELARDLLDGPMEPELRVSVLTNLAQGLFFQGRVWEAVDRCEQAIAAGGAHRGHAFALASAGVAWGTVGELDRAEARITEALVLAHQEAIEDRTLTLVLSADAVATGIRGHFRDAVAIARRALAVSDESARETHRYAPSGMTSLVFAIADEFDDAVAVLQRGRRQNEEFGTWWDATAFHWFVGLAHALGGSWDDALAEVEAGLRLAEEIGSRLLLSVAYGVLGHVALHRGELDAAEVFIARGEDDVGRTGSAFGADRVGLSRALLLEARGETRAALTVLTNLWGMVEATGAVFAYREIGPDLVRLSLSVGDVDRARATTVALEQAVADGADVPTFEGAALRCRGLVDDDPDVLIAGVEVYAHGPRPLERALAAEDAAMALARAGRTKEADRLLDEAIAIYRRLGARLDESRAARRGADEGLRRRGRSRREAISGWRSLTPTEARVAELVAEGRTNGEIALHLSVSRRTVENHVYRLFAKLEISTRAQLVGAWASREAATG